MAHVLKGRVFHIIGPRLPRDARAHYKRPGTYRTGRTLLRAFKASRHSELSARPVDAQARDTSHNAPIAPVSATGLGTPGHLAQGTTGAGAGAGSTGGSAGLGVHVGRRVNAKTMHPPPPCSSTVAQRRLVTKHRSLEHPLPTRRRRPLALLM